MADDGTQDSAGKKHNQAYGSAERKRRSIAECRDTLSGDNDNGIIIKTGVSEQRSTGPRRDEKAISALSHYGCLWCRPAPASRRQRYPAVVAASLVPPRDRPRVHHTAPRGRESSSTETGRPQPPKPWKQVRTRLNENPYEALPTCSHRRNNPPNVTAHSPRGRRPDYEELLRRPLPLSPGNTCRTRAGAAVDESIKASPVGQLEASGIDLAEESDGRSEQGGDGPGYAAPRDFFCSWECAGRWNARFSPVQARHERGLRIDIAAGRVVTR